MPYRKKMSGKSGERWRFCCFVKLRYYPDNICLLLFRKWKQSWKKENIDFEWKENGDLRIWNKLPAFVERSEFKEEIWFKNHCTYHKSHPMVGLVHRHYPFFIKKNLVRRMRLKTQGKSKDKIRILWKLRSYTSFHCF